MDYEGNTVTDTRGGSLSAPGTGKHFVSGNCDVEPEDADQQHKILEIHLKPSHSGTEISHMCFLRERLVARD